MTCTANANTISMFVRTVVIQPHLETFHLLLVRLVLLSVSIGPELPLGHEFDCQTAFAAFSNLQRIRAGDGGQDKEDILHLQHDDSVVVEVNMLRVRCEDTSKEVMTVECCVRNAEISD
jgi:hypothetical protein